MTDHPTNRSDAGMLKGAPDHSNLAALKEAMETLTHLSHGGDYNTVVVCADLNTILAALSAATERAEILQQAVHDRCAERDAAEARERTMAEALLKARAGLQIAAGWARRPDLQNARNIIKSGLDAIRTALRHARALTPETTHAE